MANRLALLWGVTPLVAVDHEPLALARTVSTCAGLSPTAVVVFVNMSVDLGRADANFLNLQRLGI